MEFAVALTELSNAHSVVGMAPSHVLPEEFFVTKPGVRSTAGRTKSSLHGDGFKAGDTAGMNDSNGGDDDDDDEEESECASSVMTKRKRQRGRKQQLSSSSQTGSASTRSDAKLERTRQLQNLRQRRYRARKKCSLSELQQRSQQLADDNAQLERAICAMLLLQ